MAKYRLKQGVNPIGKMFEMTSFAGQGSNTVKYRVFHIHGASNFTPMEEPLVFAEIATKEHYNSNPFLTLPLSKFAEVFQYAPADQIFWENIKQYQSIEEMIEDVNNVIGEGVKDFESALLGDQK